jgi:hypothetical protein
MDELTAYMMDQNIMLDLMLHAAGSCCMNTVKTADCAAAKPFIHAASDSCEGYLFSVYAYEVHVYDQLRKI